MHVFDASVFDIDNFIMPLMTLPTDVGGVSLLLEAKLVETMTEDGPLWSDNSGVEGLESESCEFWGALLIVLDEAKAELRVLSIRDICNPVLVHGLELALCNGLDKGCESKI